MKSLGCCGGGWRRKEVGDESINRVLERNQDRSPPGCVPGLGAGFVNSGRLNLVGGDTVGDDDQFHDLPQRQVGLESGLEGGPELRGLRDEPRQQVESCDPVAYSQHKLSLAGSAVEVAARGGASAGVLERRSTVQVVLTGGQVERIVAVATVRIGGVGDVIKHIHIYTANGINRRDESMKVEQNSVLDRDAEGVETAWRAKARPPVPSCSPQA